MDRQALQERFGLRGNSVAFWQLIDRVRMVAPSDITVLIEGESGVGKELIAQALHGLSARRHRPMVVVNCGAIPEGLIESELFGHEKGSYTGATERRAGYFEEADNSSIFLDEIGELPMSAQVRLLRVLESGQFSRVGSSKTQKVNTRIVAATNRNLAEEVRSGRFREDLYYRLSTVTLQVPPLRDRKEDILPLFEYFLFRFGQQYNAPRKKLDDAARSLLMQYRWPGNIRELRNTAEQATVLVRSETLTVADIQPLLRGVTANQALIYPGSNRSEDPFGNSPELLYRLLLEMKLEMREMKAVLHAMATKEGVARYGSIPPQPITAEAHWVYSTDTSSSLLPAPLDVRWSEAPPRTVKEFPKRLPDVVSFPATVVSETIEEAEIQDETSTPINNLVFQELPTFQEMEERLIREGLQRYEGNRRLTARALGISERTLYRKINELGIAAPEDEAEEKVPPRHV
ncbi:MAG: sigma-54-dependent Fis family transcriptional regulator [Bacteroidetes Order II. Incertae sedis bacterium]|nr:sigma-54-dependent Fis family transcriptional regulator [Bacteroidetes Order II. bacterium]